MMRITNKMLVNDLNRNLYANMLRMDKFQRQFSTTRRINTPSDDPAGVVKSLRLRTNLIEGEQYLANINEALGFLETTDAAFHDIDEILQKARELTGSAATDTKVKPNWAAIAKEIREMNKQLKMIANATFGSKYIFAGTNVTEAPQCDSGWIGNSEALEAEIGIGVKVPFNIDVREFFSGRLNDLRVAAASGYNGDKIRARDLQEGNYQVDNSRGMTSEVNNSLNAVGNTGMFFFYDDAGTPTAADISAGVNSVYNGDLNIQVTAVDDATDTLTVNISGRMAINGGEYQDVDIAGLTLDMAAADGAAITTITAAQLEAGGLTGATQDLIISNNSGETLSGIDAANPQFAAGDSVTLNLSSSPSTARESQSYLTAVPNSGSFFYEAMGVAATLGAGADNSPAALDNDSPYSGSILVETTRIEAANASIGPRANLEGGSNNTTATLTFTKPLYQKNAGNLEALGSGDLSDSFIYKRADGTEVAGVITAANYDAATGQVTFTFDNAHAQVEEGDTIVWNNDWDAAAGETDPESAKNTLYDQYGNEFQFVDEDGNANQAMELSFSGAPGNTWQYDDHYQAAEMTVDIKAHLYTKDGNYRYVELENIKVDTETASGQQIFKIAASDINDPNFTEDLVIWNNGNDSLGGINPDSPEIKVGDKTVISLAAQGPDDSQNVDVNFSYTSATGELVEGSSGFKFNSDVFDYHTMDLRFFTLNEQTGLEYSGEISLETGIFQEKENAVSFSWQEGLFGYMEDLARKIEAGKVTETSMELAGNDIRLEELLLYRSTVGARVNRLELQGSRLESSQITLEDLLSKNEDADMAKVIMELQMQENVYNASLAAGARIIQPSLIDFLR